MTLLKKIFFFKIAKNGSSRTYKSWLLSIFRPYFYYRRLLVSSDIVQNRKSRPPNRMWRKTADFRHMSRLALKTFINLSKRSICYLFVMYKAFPMNQAVYRSICPCLRFYTPLRMDIMRVKMWYLVPKNRKTKTFLEKWRKISVF